MNVQGINHLRLISQRIAGAMPGSPADVVAHMGGMQAQDYAAAKWAIGLRLPGAREADIDAAIANRSIVRTWPMRGTLHFVAAADLRWMLELLAPRIIVSNAGRYRDLGLDDSVLGKMADLVSEALTGGEEMTRDELSVVLARGGVPTDGNRLTHILHRLAVNRTICFGRRRLNQHTFALLDEWVEAAEPISRDEALARLALRYFRSRGPATVRDFAYWAGISVGDARTGLAIVKADLVSSQFEADEYWLAEPRQPIVESVTDAYALPGFDEFLLGYKYRTATLSSADAPKVVPGGNGVFNPTIVIDGVTVGTWRRTVKGGKVEITAIPFGTLGARDRSLFERDAGRYARFLGLSAEIR